MIGTDKTRARRMPSEATRHETPDGLILWTSDEAIEHMQVAVYVMCGGGLLGSFAAEQPADFYIDSRVGKLPYPKGSILKACKVLARSAEAAGLDPHHLTYKGFHNMGVF